jgi:transcriptional regulator with GAF, ATPase, and Fis domain
VLALELALPASAANGSPQGQVQPPLGRSYLTADEMKEFEKKNLIAALDAAGWKISGEGGAAELLGIKPSTLAYQMRAMGIESVRSKG